MVTRRLAPLVVAIAVAFAPVALDACQVMCALQPAMAAAAPAAAAHGCHELADSHSSSAVTVQGVPHRCAHGDELPAASATLLAGLAPPAIVPVVSFDLALAANEAPRVEIVASPSPPRPAKAGQLRV
jgi:hypothetical protein